MLNSYALISVSDKTNIAEVAKALVDKGVNIISTGGTLKVLQDKNIPVKAVESFTEFPELMDGRVKTLHPKIHGGILANRKIDHHMDELKDHEMPKIDYVIANLYPFEETVLNSDHTSEDLIENIDIGGVTLLRSAAKNYQAVSIITDPKDYPNFIQQIEINGKTSETFRKYLAIKAFQSTAHYDTIISQTLAESQPITGDDQFEWPFATFSFTSREELRYGENNHQKAAYYKATQPKANEIASANQLNGKALSYNNIKDADTALKIVQEFQEPMAVSVKHMNPSGAAIGETIEEAFERCYKADNISIYGGIVAVNRPVTLALAERLSDIFLEIIITPEFEADAFEFLSKKKNLRLLEVDTTASENSGDQLALTSVSGGLLVQSADEASELNDPSQFELMTDREPTDKELKAMQFNMKIVKFVKSNAIVVGNEYMTLGIGAGQMNRVQAADIAIKQAKANDDNLRSTFVMASDAFLPMADTAELAAKHNISAIIQPGGSIHDDKSVEVCNAENIAMVKTDRRHFRH